MHRVPTKRDNPRTRHTWRERAFLSTGVGVAVTTSAVSLTLDAGLEFVGPVWLAAFAWTMLASIAHALWRGFRRGDWSAFREAYEPPHHRDVIDLGTGTGVGAYRRIAERNERLMRSSPSF